MHSPLGVILLAIGMLALIAGDGNADRRKARALYDEGFALYTLGRYDDAIGRFEAGFLEDRRPAFLFNIAQAHKAAGRTSQAATFYKRYLEMAPDASDRGAVEQLLKTVDAPQAQAASAAAPGTAVAQPTEAPISSEPASEPSGGTLAPGAQARPPRAVSTVTSLSAAPQSDELLALAPEALEEKQPAPAAAAPAPVYKRWWLWAIVGGVVAVGAGAGIGAAASGPQDAAVPPSALGSATLRF